MKVLIADDSAIVRERIVTMLSDLEEVKIIGEAQNADETVELVYKLKPDVVILDIRMPGNGISILPKIKDSKDAPIVIMFTNYPYEQYRKKCMEAGAEYFFDKSVGIEEIIKILNQLIQDFKK